MKLICVTGRSGSGKSVFGEKLKQNLGEERTLFLNLDHISAHHISNQTYSREEMIKHFERQFGVAIESNDQYSELFRKGRKVTDKLDDPLYLQIEQTIDSVLQDTDAEYVILDWLWLPKTKYFDNCDYRVLIKAIDNGLRIKKILEREGKELRQETYENYRKRLFLREKYALDYDLYDYDLVVYNDYSSQNTFDDTIQKTIQKLCSTVK